MTIIGRRAGLTFAGLVLGLAMAAPPGRTQPQGVAPVLTTLAPLTVADARPAEHLWSVGRADGVVFRSLAAPALRAWVRTLPRGSQIRYFHFVDGKSIRITLPTATQMGRVWATPLPADVERFRRYCEKWKVRFLVVTSAA